MFRLPTTGAAEITGLSATNEFYSRILFPSRGLWPRPGLRPQLSVSASPRVALQSPGPG